jgi:hypothetical protein
MVRRTRFCKRSSLNKGSTRSPNAATSTLGDAPASPHPQPISTQIHRRTQCACYGVCVCKRGEGHTHEQIRLGHASSHAFLQGCIAALQHVRLGKVALRKVQCRGRLGQRPQQTHRGLWARHTRDKNKGVRQCAPHGNARLGRRRTTRDSTTTAFCTRLRCTSAVRTASAWPHRATSLSVWRRGRAPRRRTDASMWR